MEQICKHEIKAPDCNICFKVSEPTLRDWENLTDPSSLIITMTCKICSKEIKEVSLTDGGTLVSDLECPHCKYKVSINFKS